MRLLLGTTDIAHYYSNLKHGFDLIGVKTSRCDFSDSDPKTNRLLLPRLIATMLQKSRSGSLGKRLCAKVVGGVFSLIYFVYCLVKYTDFIFCYTTSLLPYNLDLPILKAFGKRVIWSFHGTDLRPAYMDGTVIYDENGNRRSVHEIYNWNKTTKKRARWIERWVGVVVAQPCHSQFLTKPFVSQINIGNPVSETKHNLKCEIDFVANKTGEHPIRIVHAPSHLAGKGTREVRKAIENVKKHGYNIEYIEVYNRPHSEVIDEIMKCDFVIDQMYSDLPMPVFSIEAATYSKPSIVCGYAGHIFYDFFNRGEIPPTLYRPPNLIEYSIEELINYPVTRKNLGVAAREYVTKNWDDRCVAGKYWNILDSLRNGYDCFGVDPRSIVYVNGCAIDKTKERHIIQNIVDHYGTKGLLIDDKYTLDKIREMVY